MEAVRFAFQRFDEADLSVRALAREMHAKGFPAPRAGGWHDKSVYNILTTRAYVGTARWNHRPRGKYNQVRAGELVSVTGNGTTPRVALPDDAVEVPDVHEGFIDREQFDRVQRKLANQKTRHPSGARIEYPLTGLIVCGHCGKPMQGHITTKDKYTYRRYNCSTYLKYGPGGKNTTCSSHNIGAPRVLGWIVHTLQETYLGPGRDELVQQIKAELTAATKADGGDVERLQKKAEDLDREVGRLVKAIRTIDAGELVEEFSIVRAEPAVLREVLRQFVSRIVCEWEPYQTKRGNTRQRFKKGTVELRPIAGYASCGYCEDRRRDAAGEAAAGGC